MNILSAIADPNLFRPFLGDDLDSWRPWQTALRALYGNAISATASKALVKQCTGRDATRLPTTGFDSALFLTGRRSGKSRIAAIIGAFEAALSGNEKRLAPGESGVVAIVSPSRYQSRIVKDYLRAIFQAPLLADEIVSDTIAGFELRNGTRIEILVGDYRSVRGYTLLNVCIDEACFIGFDAESKVRSDTELIRAVLPGLATTGGKLIAISSPYARRGWCYKTWQQCYGNDNATTLVWNAPSRTMNPTLSQRVVDKALAEDLAAAKSEYMGEWRDDVSNFLPRAVIEQLVVPGRYELLPDKGLYYSAFCDVSGGRSDDGALCISHTEGRTVVIDVLRRYRPPFNPHHVIKMMADELKRFGLRRVVGDNYSADFCVSTFAGCGIAYQRSEKNKSELYLELLPRLCSGEIELLDDESLINQLAGLERRTRAGGKDVIDHPNGQHDDLANAVAGAVAYSAKPMIVVGGF